MWRSGDRAQVDDGLEGRRMTSVRTLAAHDLVELRYPRTPSERNEIGIAVGRAIDGAVSHYSHEAALGRRPSATAMARYGEELLEEALAEVVEPPSAEGRETIREEIRGVLREFRRSVLFGLSRPRSRLVLVGEQAGYYAQPDFWDRKNRFFEMKTYRALPPPPDVALQLKLFLLAFAPGTGSLVCFDRHVRPVETLTYEVPPLTSAEAEELLRFAHASALELGAERVLEFMNVPVVRYPLPPPGASPP
ncbi:MAG: hypothetical protein L3K13_07570 [Thermoplasmata archaeon]|nr:hypothetical protein [Thermoplasmata archaeon]